MTGKDNGQSRRWSPEGIVHIPFDLGTLPFVFGLFFLALFFWFFSFCQRINVEGMRSPSNLSRGTEYTQVAFGLRMLTIMVQRTAFEELTVRQNGGYQNEETKVDGIRKAQQQPSGTPRHVRTVGAEQPCIDYVVG